MPILVKKGASGRARRKVRIRKKVNGTAVRPRLNVFRSAKHIYAQVIDDDSGKTLASASTVAKGVREGLSGKKTERASLVGAAIAERCKALGIETVVFDRNGYKYHGRVKAVAEAAREAGLKV
ncbi:MAG: 50S ribosomal protein L18 [Deltaproteobacteria bacterium RIFOXYA12_FULL_58_15]|nr:MAG: 50S ribosomal protein L18 [Deltaproteobacteria bacterium RIFOXYA12_FULL_58_15]OGR15330.1 MAG: 50S ribosomal protein L18 [Deltaproteobacteria bacterium RIFOXYB12_FULL_58_9]